MKKLSLISLVLLLALVACAPYMYGVPQESWDRMSEPERIEAMRVYERDQQARRQAAEERARRQAIEDQARRQAAEERARYEALERQREQARQAALERERRERIERIHRGDGAYGELVRVRLQGGTIRVSDRLYRYEPLTFAIAEGESRRFIVAEVQGRTVDLDVSYGGGALTIEGVRFSYDRSWGRGRLYEHSDSGGELQLRNVDVFVEVHDRSSRHERESSRLVIYREPDPPPIRERDHHVAPPVIIKEREQTRPPQVIPPKPLPPKPQVVDLLPHSVEINVLAGEMKVRGRMQQLERVGFRLADGESREMTLRADGEQRVVVFYYGKGELYVDGTPGRGRDAQKFTYEKGWRSGTVYRLVLKGHNQVDKLELKVTAR
jgi:hypothetical protein